MTDTLPPALHISFPCNACGAEMAFDPPTDGMMCPHCGHQRAIETSADARRVAKREIRFDRALDAQIPSADFTQTKILDCGSCGAQVEWDDTTQATECPFCATALVTGTGEHRQIKPQGVLPFQLTEDAARAAMTAWLGKLWFAPNGLAEYARKGRKMAGLYLPFWTYDAVTATDYKGRRGDEYTTTRTVQRNGKSETETTTRIRWTPVKGHVAKNFDDVLVIASHALPEKFRDRVGEFDLNALEPFRADYLAGFGAEAYTVPLDEGFDDAKEIMERAIRKAIRQRIGGDKQQITWMETQHSGVTFKHVLLPIWLAAYSFRGKTYRFMVNARSGHVVGERPWSWVKIGLALLLAAAVAGGIAYWIWVNQEAG